MCSPKKMNRRGGIYNASSSRSFIQCSQDEDDSSRYYHKSCSDYSSSSTTSNDYDYDPQSSSRRTRGMIRRRNGIILSSRERKWTTQCVSVENDHDNRGAKSPSQEDDSRGSTRMSSLANDLMLIGTESCGSTIIGSNTTPIIKRNHIIIIDNKTGFDSNHEGNQLFLAILHTYYSEMYENASSCITYRRLILNVVLDDMYSRGFRFLWRENGKYVKIHDNMVILKRIRKKLKENPTDFGDKKEKDY